MHSVLSLVAQWQSVIANAHRILSKRCLAICERKTSVLGSMGTRDVNSLKEQLIEYLFFGCHTIVMLKKRKKGGQV